MLGTKRAQLDGGHEAVADHEGIDLEALLGPKDGAPGVVARSHHGARQLAGAQRLADDVPGEAAPASRAPPVAVPLLDEVEVGEHPQAVAPRSRRIGGLAHRGHPGAALAEVVGHHQQERPLGDQDATTGHDASTSSGSGLRRPS